MLAKSAEIAEAVRALPFSRTPPPGWTLSGFELGERLGDLAYRDQLTWLNIVIQQEGWGGPVVIFEPIQNVWFVP